jgi:hypothetical protein
MTRLTVDIESDEILSPGTGVTEEQWAVHKQDLAARLPFRAFCYQRIHSNGEVHHLIYPVFVGRAPSKAIERRRPTSQPRSRPKRDCARARNGFATWRRLP